MPSGAPSAFAAGRDEREDDLVARSERCGAGAHRLDDPGTFVPAGERIDPDRKVAGGNVIVGVAEPGGDQPDADLILARILDVEVDDFVTTRRLLDYRAAASHRY